VLSDTDWTRGKLVVRHWGPEFRRSGKLSFNLDFSDRLQQRIDGHRNHWPAGVFKEWPQGGKFLAANGFVHNTHDDRLGGNSKIHYDVKAVTEAATA